MTKAGGPEAGRGTGRGQAAPPALPLGFATVDLDRPRRQGLPEVVYAPGKQPAEIAAIAAALLDRTSGPVLVTRLEPGAAAEVADEVAAARDRERRWRPVTTTPGPGCCAGGPPRQTGGGWRW